MSADVCRAIKRQARYLTYTPESTAHNSKIITAWCRLHRVDPDRCFRVLLVHWFPIPFAVISLYDVDSSGKHFLRDGELAWHWTLRVVRLPLPYELSEESLSLWWTRFRERGPFY